MSRLKKVYLESRFKYFSLKNFNIENTVVKNAVNFFNIFILFYLLFDLPVLVIFK